MNAISLALAMTVGTSAPAAPVHTTGWQYRQPYAHQQYHDDLEHRDFHRHLEHREAHRYPMSRWQHGQLHDSLDHDAYHDRLEHRQYHRNRYYTPYRWYGGYGYQPGVRYGW